MPLYDYICLDCHERFDLFISYSEYGKRAVVCSQCGSANVRRRVPRVRMLKSEESRLESLADPSALAGMEDDPKALGQMMRKMSGELGEGMPPEFDEVIDRLESGQSPEDIEKALPDLGGADNGGGDDDL
jgi:putative FmdB family regulatory protein